jgi:hypothetical protein
MKSLALGSGLLFAVWHSSACDLCAVYNASAARGEATAGWHLSLAEQFTHSGTLQEGGEEISDPIGQFRDSSITSLLISYNFNERLGLSLNLPFIARRFKRPEGFDVERGTESGLGDMSLLGRYVLYAKPEHDYSLFLSLLGGIEFPTGDPDRLREEINEVEVPGAPESGVHGDSLALGSGSYDFIAGFSGNARWRRLAFALDLQYFIRTRGEFDYRFGNELSVSGGPGFFLLFREEMSLAAYASINYETKEIDRIAGVKKDEGILTSWYAGPGLILTWGENFSATANVDFPLTIATRGVQAVPDYRIRAGLNWNF